MKKSVLFLILAIGSYNLYGMNFLGIKKKQKNITNADYAAFIKACAGGDLKEVKKLVKKGVDVNHVYLEGTTVLMLVCANGWVNIAEYLIKKGADINAHDNTGETPLMKACIQHRPKTIEFLVKSGANVNAQDNNGNAALHFVCSDNNEVFIYREVPFLVECGANLDIPNNLGKKPSYYLDRPGQVNSGFKEAKRTRNFNREKLAGYFDDTFLKFKMISSPGDNSTLNVLPQDMLNEINERFIRISESTPDVQEVLDEHRQ